MVSAAKLPELERAVGVPVNVLAGLCREGQDENWHVIDAAPHNQRFRNTDGDTVQVSVDLLVYAQDGGVGIGADEKTCGDDGAIITGLRVDVFYAVDPLDDVFQRLGHEFYRIARFQAVEMQVDVDQVNADLGFLLTREIVQRDHAHCNRRQQK